VAHRLDSVVHADRILMLEQGVLVASGTHGELMAGSERYRDLWSLQPAAPATDRSEPGNGAQPEPRAAERPAVRKPLEAGGAA
jgi:ATP-binding cassette subfamily B protein